MGKFAGERGASRPLFIRFGVCRQERNGHGKKIVIKKLLIKKLLSSFGILGNFRFSIIPSFRVSGASPSLRRSAITSFRIWGDFPPFLHSAILSFRIWSHFPPFRDSTIPPFDRSTVPSFLLSGSHCRGGIPGECRSKCMASLPSYLSHWWGPDGPAKQCCLQLVIYLIGCFGVYS